jgi:unsaturated chondroitin disaccharide hydrolase
MALLDRALLERTWGRLESRGRSIIREWPDAKPGEYLIFNQNNGAVFAGASSFDGYGAVGLLWLLYAATDDPEYRDHAQRGAHIFSPLADVLASHCGIAAYRSAVWGYQLTGEEDLKRQGLRAAATMSRFFDPQNEVFGRHPGARAEAVFPAGGVKHRFHSVHAPANTPARATHIDWSGFWFEVLWWGGRFEPRFSDQARRHCDAYLRLGFQRPDGSSHHGLSFDEHTGEPLEFHSNQAYSADTAWSRGQAWMLMGYAQAFEATGERRFLDTWLRCADYWIAHLPDDLIPFYDMSDPAVPHVPRDVCSAVIALNSMLRVCRVDPSLESRFRDVAEATLRELLDFYITPGGIVLHGSWGADHQPMFQGVLMFSNTYLADAVFMGLWPDRFDEIRGF